MLSQVPAASMDACITDPPYDLTNASRNGSPRNPGSGPFGRHTVGSDRGFMGRTWDGTGVAFDPQTWAAVVRTLKPGAPVLVFGGSRTWHRVIRAMTASGITVHGTILWAYSSGFPKSLDVSKAIDRLGGAPSILDDMAAVLRAARERRGMSIKDADSHFCDSSTAWPWYEGRLYKGQVRVVAPEEDRANKIAAEWPETADVFARMRQKGAFRGTRIHACSGGEDFGEVVGATARPPEVNEFDPATPAAEAWRGWGTALKPAWEPIIVGTAGPAAAPDLPPLIYCAKAPQRERPRYRDVAHETVKPLTLIRQLVTAVSVTGNRILDPFLGSGTLAEAALCEQRDFLGCELTEEYLPLIAQRIRRAELGLIPGSDRWNRAQRAHDARLRARQAGQLDLFAAAEQQAS